MHDGKLAGCHFEQFVEMIETDLRPALQVFATGGQLITIEELQLGDHRFAFLDVRGLELEDVNDAVYHADRDLTQLLNAGVLEKAAGFVIGTLTGWEKHEAVPPINMPEKLWTEFFTRLGKPTLSGFPFGHEPNALPMPLSVRASLDADARSLVLLEAAVSNG